MTDEPENLADLANHEDRERLLLVLYRQAFAEFGTRALWNIRQFETPTVGHALSVARHLRIEGNMAARRLAEDIEKAANAAL